MSVLLLESFVLFCFCLFVCFRLVRLLFKVLFFYRLVSLSVLLLEVLFFCCLVSASFYCSFSFFFSDVCFAIDFLVLCHFDAVDFLCFCLDFC